VAGCKLISWICALVALSPSTKVSSA